MKYLIASLVILCVLLSAQFAFLLRVSSLANESKARWEVFLQPGRENPDQQDAINAFDAQVRAYHSP